MEAVGAAEDGFYEEEEEEVTCYDFEPLPTLLEDEVSAAGWGQPHGGAGGTADTAFGAAVPIAAPSCPVSPAGLGPSSSTFFIQRQSHGPPGWGAS